MQNIDPEEYGGIAEIIKEGFMTTFAIFLVRKFDFFYILNVFLILGYMDRILFYILYNTFDIIIF